MSIQFDKYQATGNDFIMIDNRDKSFPTNDNGLIERLCDRRFGIGSDGIILIEESQDADFGMIFYNPDGSQSLCGNGSRCAVSFAKSMGKFAGSHVTFMAYDGLHAATIDGELVELSMRNTQNISFHGKYMFLDTGSPHVVRFVENVEHINIIEEGRYVRKSSDFQPNGTNVNFIQVLNDDTIFVRTYERGVENETYSCGTGVTAAALATSTKHLKTPVNIITKGGELSVNYAQTAEGVFEQITLRGPAKKVYSGKVDF